VTLAEELPALQARLDVPLVALLLEAVVEADEDEFELELVLLAVGATLLPVLFAVLVVTVAGAHAASTRMLIAITRLKKFFRLIYILHLCIVPHACKLEVKIFVCK